MTAVRPTKKTFELVVERDEGRCAFCGGEVWGERGFHFSLHHRRRAGSGGDRRPATHAPGNLILLHGSGVTSCHGEVESQRKRSYLTGFLVKADHEPTDHPIVHAVHGLVWLLDDGSISRQAPQEAA